ncbi:MAG: hypothetical protein Q8Q33_05310, partial [Chlamydiota bacterium]|nr:hypothetical protein [Chlamydiota bacterium]
MNKFISAFLSLLLIIDPLLTTQFGFSSDIIVDPAVPSKKGFSKICQLNPLGGDCGPLVLQKILKNRGKEV